MTVGSIRERLIAGTIIALALALTIGGFALSSAFQRTVETTFHERLDSLLLTVVAAIDVEADGSLRLGREIPHPSFGRVYSGWYWQVTSGDSRLASRSLWDAELSGPMALGDAGRASLTMTGPRDQLLRVAVRELHYPSRRDAVTVTVAGPESELRGEIDSFNRLLVLSLGVLALTMIGAVAAQVGYGLRPFRALGVELGDIRAGRRTRLTGGYPREIEPLAQAMNDVLDQDARRIERARSLAGNLAHGLKTPLSVLALEAARPAPDPGRITAQVSRMTRVIDHHLARAAAAGAQQAIAISTGVHGVVSELRAMLLRIHAERLLSIDADVPADLMFAGERQDLEEMLGNLIDNACKWAAARVIVRATGGADWFEITVDDDGHGLPADDANSALQRGVRLDSAEPGTGLGLAITGDLARLYGGTLILGRSDIGGLRATLRLPA